MDGMPLEFATGYYSATDVQFSKVASAIGCLSPPHVSCALNNFLFRSFFASAAQIFQYNTHTLDSPLSVLLCLRY